MLAAITGQSSQPLQTSTGQAAKKSVRGGRDQLGVSGQGNLRAVAGKGEADALIFDLRKPDFWQKSLTIVADRVKQFVDLADQILAKSTALQKQIAQGRAWIGRGKKRPVSVPAGAAKELLDRRAQVHDDAALAQRTAVLGRQHGAAPGGHDDIGASRTHIEHLALSFTEPLLAFDLKDHWDAYAAACLELVVEINKFALQRLGQAAPNGRFTRTHHAHQENGLAGRARR